MCPRCFDDANFITYRKFDITFTNFPMCTISPPSQIGITNVACCTLIFSSGNIHTHTHILARPPPRVGIRFMCLRWEPIMTMFPTKIYKVTSKVVDAILNRKGPLVVYLHRGVGSQEVMMECGEVP